MSTIFRIQRTPTTSAMRGAAQHDQPGLRREQQHDVVLVHHEHVERDPERHERQHPRGEPALRRQHADLAAHRRAFAQRVGHVVQDLGQVASDLALDVHGEDRPLEVGAPHAFGQRTQGVLGAPAEPDLGDDPLELGGGGLCDLLGGRVERLQEAVTGSQRAGHDRQDVGELFAELLRAATERELQRHRRPESGDGPHTERDPRAPEDGVSDEQACERGTHGHDDELARAQAHGRGLELRVEPAAEPAGVGEPPSEVRHAGGDPPAGGGVRLDVRHLASAVARRRPCARR